MVEECSNQPLSLKLAVQTYDWGRKGHHSLVARLALSGSHINSISESSTYAELWLGAHPSGPSLVDTQSLDRFLARTGLPELPFLFKVLSVGQALSIQSHPDAVLAKKLHAARPDVYKDPNPKPEMAIALTLFTALLGFRPWSEIQKSIRKFPLFSEAVCLAGLPSEAEDSFKTRLCYEKMMRLGKDEVSDIIDSILAKNETSEQDLISLVKDLHTTYPGGDVGVLSVFFLNFLRLSPGEAIFIPANTPHAYLSGEILECMQNSDNVIRGGLTPKFKDVEVLIDSLSYDPFSGERVAPEIALSHGWQVWRPVDLFGVTKVDTEGTWKSSATALGIILGGSARIGGVQRGFGWAGVFLPDAAVEICQCSSNFVIFIADSL